MNAIEQIKSREKEFWGNVEKSDGCWNWKGLKMNGYAFFYVYKKHTYASAFVSCVLLKNHKEFKVIIGRRCKNKLCVNPEHLYMKGNMLIRQFKNVRRQKNIQDRLNKGKQSGFVEHLRRIRNRIRDKKQTTDIDIDYLMEIWNEQKGKCAYTDVILTQPNHKNKGENKIYTASVDRKDSSKGYVKGNIQYVSISINYMKSTLSDIEMKKFISIVKES